MKHLGIAMAVIGIGLTTPALAQSNATKGAPSAGTAAQSPDMMQQNSQAAAQKIKQDLQAAGFQDVNVVARSFVVQAKTKDGDPVVMTIGPHGMSVFEALNASPSSSSDQTGTVNKNGTIPKQ